MKITTKLTGSKKDGFVMRMENDMDGFKFDESFIEEELISMRDAINKKLK